MKIVIADTKTGKCYQLELDQVKSRPLYGKEIGNDVDGSLLGLGGYTLKITGGTDRDGFPMRKDMHGLERKRILISRGPGLRKMGERRKKTVRGSVIAEDIAQINLKVIKYGEKEITSALGIAEKKPAEGPK